jgi:hypothetical protein
MLQWTKKILWVLAFLVVWILTIYFVVLLGLTFFPSETPTEHETIIIVCGRAECSGTLRLSSRKGSNLSVILD